MSDLLIGVKPVWESDRYDVALAGHAWYNGEYGTFGILNFGEWSDDTPPRYAFFRAKTTDDAIRLMAERQLFEDMVGHHCTYGVRSGFDRSQAIDFDAFYGGDGKEMHPVRAVLEQKEPETEYVGDFEMQA